MKYVLTSLALFAVLLSIPAFAVEQEPETVAAYMWLDTKDDATTEDCTQECERVPESVAGYIGDWINPDRDEQVAGYIGDWINPDRD